MNPSIEPVQKSNMFRPQQPPPAKKARLTVAGMPDQAKNARRPRKHGVKVAPYADYGHAHEQAVVPAASQVSSPHSPCTVATTTTAANSYSTNLQVGTGPSDRKSVV